MTPASVVSKIKFLFQFLDFKSATRLFFLTIQFYIKIKTKRLTGIYNHIYKVNIKDDKSPFYLRMGDLPTFYEIFMEKVYDTNLLNEKNERLNIVDLGAHIGCSHRFFRLKYPHAMIVSVEPEKKNFKLLSMNANGNHIENKAIGIESGLLFLNHSESSNNHSISDTGEAVPAISMTDLCNKYGINQVDLLKIDIEGYEEELLQKPENWIKKVTKILIELHGNYEERALIARLAKFNFSVSKNANGIIMAIKNN
ncbi:MAG TPA: FkbM family methyltransferase [Saprospiraceae bacterium]|nr:FkbM family methyltransferase [Saprospiraceae bacterium]